MTITPNSYIMFAIVNFIVWPGFALVYWYVVQREEEELMRAMSAGAQQTGTSAEG